MFRHRTYGSRVSEYNEYPQTPAPQGMAAPKRPIAAIAAALLMIPTALSYVAIVLAVEYLVSAFGETFAAEVGKAKVYLILAAIVIALVYLAVMIGIFLGRDLARAAAFTISGVNLLCCGGLMAFATGVIAPLNDLLSKAFGAADVGSAISAVFITLFASQILTVVLLGLPNVSRWFASKTR